jgi:hypothetical protein
VNATCACALSSACVRFDGTSAPATIRLATPTTTPAPAAHGAIRALGRRASPDAVLVIAIGERLWNLAPWTPGAGSPAPVTQGGSSVVQRGPSAAGGGPFIRNASSGTTRRCWKSKSPPSRFVISV